MNEAVIAEGCSTFSRLVREGVREELQRGGAQGVAQRAVAAAAAAAASPGASALRNVAHLLGSLSHEGLQCMVAGHALLGLQLCDYWARESVNVLVEGFKDVSDEKLVMDSAWTLNKITRSDWCTVQWVKDAGGLKAVSAALTAFPRNADLVKCSIGITYTLVGMEGLLEVVSHTDFPNDVVVEALWAVIDLYKESHSKSEMQQHKAGLFRFALDLIRTRGDDTGMLKACCCTVEALLKDDACLMQLLVDVGGVDLLLKALQRSSELAKEDGAEDLAYVCCSVISSLKHYGSALQLQVRLQGTKVSEQLEAIARRNTGSATEEQAMVALAQLQGLQTVTNIMINNRTCRSVVRGGFVAIIEFIEDTDLAEVKTLPDILGALWHLKADMEKPEPPVKCRRKCVSAICSVAKQLAHYWQPAELPILWQAVACLLKDTESEVESVLRHSSSSTSQAETLIEALGRIALSQPAWQEVLQKVGSLQLASRIISTAVEHPSLVKYSFWFAACIAGIPFVAEHLNLQKTSHVVVDAAFCSIIDILDDDVQGEWVLAHQRRVPPDHVPQILELLCEVMQIHAASKVLMYRGCHCIGLIGTLVPTPGGAPQLERAVGVLCSAVWRHRFNIEVVRDAFFAFRCLLRFSRGQPDAGVLARLQHERADEIAIEAFTNFANGHQAEVLEHAAFVLAAVSGLEAVLEEIHKYGPSFVRTCAVKALHEYCQEVALDAIPPQVVKNAGEAVHAMMQESPGDETFQRHGEMLRGQCIAMLEKVAKA